MFFNDKIGNVLAIIFSLLVAAIIIIVAVSLQGCSAYATNPSMNSEFKRDKLPASLIQVDNWGGGYSLVELNVNYISTWPEYSKEGFLISSFFYKDSALYSINLPPAYGGIAHSCLFSFDGYHYMEYIHIYKGDQFTVCTPVELSLLGITLGYWDFTVYEVEKDYVLLNYQGFHWEFILNEEIYDDSVEENNE